jgi:CBS domain-containing protein
MLARDVMTSPPITVGPDTSVSEVATLLLERRISAVPVVDPEGRMIGIVSEGDLLRRADAKTERRRSSWMELLLDRNVSAADFVKTHGNRASDVMTRSVVTVAPDADLADIAALLERKRIKRVPVVENDRIVGIVSRANLLHGLVAHPKPTPVAGGADSDATIRENIDAALAGLSGVDLRRINVVVKDAVVYLWGTVKSDNQRRALTVAAENAPGVVRVEDNLHGDTFPGSAG